MEKRTYVQHSAYGSLVSGGIAGAVSRTATSPLERLRILQQTMPKGNQLGSLNLLQTIYKMDGARGYFKGNGANCIKIIPFSACEFYFYDAYQKMVFPKKQKQDLRLTDKMICGGLAGMTASYITYPFDLIKTHLTVNMGDKRTGMWETGKHIVNTRGFMGLYQGIGMTLAGITPFIGIKLASYDFLMDKVPQRQKNIYTKLGVGAVAGTIAVTLTYPSDLVRKLLQLNGQPGHSYDNVFDCCKQLYARNGIPGFYKGLMATYAKVAPMTGILFYTNEKIKTMFLQ